MAGTPASFAETPDRRTAAGPDLLSEVLKAVRLTGAVFLNACFTAPFGVIDPKSYDQRTPMARLRHVSILHLMELLFVELLRRHVARLPPGSRGWFAALNDPIVARALQLLHADPAHRWTVDEIARRIGSSRTVLAERFNALLGRPPIDYLVSWRIQIAADRLRAGSESIPRIAESAGFESEASFNRAFKRVTGMTPGSWRDGAELKG
jgi:AraC-like DNA-binding protein